MKHIQLGIHYGHNATVAVVADGELIFCQSEERFNRLKNSTGFPKRTLEYVYDNICSPKEVEMAVLSQASINGYLFLKRCGFKSFQYGHYLSPEIDYGGWFARSELKWKMSQWRARALRERDGRLRREALEYFSGSLRLPQHKVKFLDHHAAHAYSTYANISDWNDGLVFTLDGVGDYLSATVNRLQRGRLEVLQRTDHRNSLGYFYSAITALMGMRAGEHEFKVMGLAPYSSRQHYQKIVDDMRNMIKVDDRGQFVARHPPSNLTKELERTIRYQRFDNIAGAIQALTEELILEWIAYWTKDLGVKNASVAGGVFMNVKACQQVMDSGMVNKLFVMPSAADETTAIGAAFWGALQEAPETPLAPIRDLYLGRDYSQAEIDAALRDAHVKERYDIVRPDNINHTVAQLLATNEVVARYCGRMEFGARALGNRSILANPSHIENIELINSLIKSRDFWMPFTPSIVESDMDRYIEGHEKVFAPYMCITFNTTELARKHIKAAIHPRDKTARPQCVVRDWNPGYYELIAEFKRLTGIGAILNTSFNLHGEPNVCSPSDAIYTMDWSGLQYLALGPYLLKKKTSHDFGNS